MLVLLPPSETKRGGGDHPPLDLATLRFPSLTSHRRVAIDALVRLSEDEDVAARVLKLGARQRGEVADNARLTSAPTMPAIDRYTGVLYDALDAGSLAAPARAWLGSHVSIHTAPFGPVGALDPIPAYRLAAGVSLPPLGSQRAHWASPAREALAGSGAAFLLDLRSKAYAQLGPLPDVVEAVTVDVVTSAGDGVLRALNHFNKAAKGRLVRALASAGATPTSATELLHWAHQAGIDLRPGEDAGRLLLVTG